MKFLSNNNFGYFAWYPSLLYGKNNLYLLHLNTNYMNISITFSNTLFEDHISQYISRAWNPASQNTILGIKFKKPFINPRITPSSSFHVQLSRHIHSRVIENSLNSLIEYHDEETYKKKSIYDLVTSNFYTKTRDAGHYLRSMINR